MERVYQPCDGYHNSYMAPEFISWVVHDSLRGNELWVRIGPHTSYGS